jgi:hypothetical protein
MEKEIPNHLLGYTNGRKWLDMSRYVVHFTNTEASFSSILREGFIRPSGPFGWGRTIAQVQEVHKSACFSEVPLNHIQRLMDRHGSWGIGFKKEFIAQRGGGRVWYIDDGTPLNDAIFDAIRVLLRSQDFSSSWWKATPFMDRVMPQRYEFEWEREWRVPGGLRFSYADIAFAWPRDASIIEQISVESRPAWTPSGEVVGDIESNLSSIGDDGERLIEEFFRDFKEPINELYYDESGGFVWLSTPWQTEDAVDHVFPTLETSLRAALVEVLSAISNEWVYLNDLYGESDQLSHI